MLEVSVEPGVSYEALSYTWEPVLPRDFIEVDKHHLIIGANLSAALHELRYINRPRRLWVDAICISQEDVSERGHQVSLIREFYRKRKRGRSLAWVW